MQRDAIGSIEAWFYFDFLRPVLRLWPHPVWRFPALLLGVVRACHDRELRRSTSALLEVVGHSRSWVAWWNLYWAMCHRWQEDTLLLMQADKITPEWLMRHVRLEGHVPPDGAVLVAPHHANARIGPMYLATLGFPLVGISSDDTPEYVATLTPLGRRIYRAVFPLRPRIYRRVIPRSVAARGALRALREGMTIMMYADNPVYHTPPTTFLGRALDLPRGSAWLAERSGKPLIPYMVVPEGDGWCLWLGEPVEPTRVGLTAALEASLRRAPGSWYHPLAHFWRNAPPFHEHASYRRAPQGTAL